MADDGQADGADFLHAPHIAPDVAPGRGRVPHRRGAGKQQLVRERLIGYYGAVGLIAGRFSIADSQAIIARATQCADAHLEVGKVNPQYMRVLEAITLYGPYVELAMVHVDLGVAILRNHDRNPLEMLNPLAGLRRGGNSDEQAAPPVQTADNSVSPLPYVPVGAHAPTDTKAPPATIPLGDAPMLIYPDEDLPADIDIQLRQVAKASGRPYDELVREAKVAIAQMRMEQNGHTATPGALGAPVAKE